MNPDFPPKSYRDWIIYIIKRSKEGTHHKSVIRRLYDLAVSKVPEGEDEKYQWEKTYLDLWIMYAKFEEIDNRDLELAGEVYSRVLDLIPHQRFSFARVWLSAAKLAIRRHDLLEASRILESAIETLEVPSNSFFELYVRVIIIMGEKDVSRCRTLLENYEDSNSAVWLIYLEFESHIWMENNPDKVRFLYDIVLNKDYLEEAKEIWISYIKFELSVGEFHKANSCFEEYLRYRGDDIVVWIYYARFAASVGEIMEDRERVFEPKGKRVLYFEFYVELVKEIFERGIDYFSERCKPDMVNLLSQESIYLKREFDFLQNVELVSTTVLQNMYLVNRRKTLTIA